MAARRIVAFILVGILVFGLVLAFSSEKRDAFASWIGGIFSSESASGDDATTPAGDETTDPTGDQTTDPAGDETTDPTEDQTTNPTEGEESGDVAIADLPEEERMEAIQKRLNELAAREDGDNVYSVEDAFLKTMYFVVTEDGKILESGHNMAAPGVETYSMDTLPGGWVWDEVTEPAKVLLFISGHKISVVQSQVAANTEYVPADDQLLEIAVCKHGNSLLSGYFVREQGDLAVVTFDAETFSALKNVFRWWRETVDGKEVIKIGFAYCNDAPEGVEGVIPIIVPSLGK